MQNKNSSGKLMPELESDRIDVCVLHAEITQAEHKPADNRSCIDRQERVKFFCHIYHPLLIVNGSFYFEHDLRFVSSANARFVEYCFNCLFHIPSLRDIIPDGFNVLYNLLFCPFFDI